MWEKWIRSLGLEAPLEKEMATHSSILAWEILWTEEPGGLQFMGSQRVGHDWASMHTHTSLSTQAKQSHLGLPEQKACLGAVGNTGPHLTLTASDLDENRQVFLEESFHYESHDGRFKDLLGNQRTRQLSMQKPRFTSGQSGNTGQGKQLCIFWVQEHFCSLTSVPYICFFFHTNPDNKSGSALGVRASRLMWQNPTGKTVAVERGIKPSGLDRGEVSLGWKMCLVAWTG